MTTPTKIADIIAETLEALDIRHAFGIIGAGNVHVFEAIAKRGFTEIVCVHHEQAAAMAMQTYYRTSGRMAVCLSTTGAGSTNAVTGVVSAWADSIPGIVIAGNENSHHATPTNPLRMWGVQGYDGVHMVEKVTKYAVRVSNPIDVMYELQKCAHIALDQRPGPVWIEVPMDVQSSVIDREMLRSFSEIKEDSPCSDDLRDQARKVVESLISNDRPILWLGHGIKLAGAEDKIPTLLEKLGIPALVSWAGIDMVDSDHPLVYGRAGVYGQRSANFVLQNSSYVLAIGTRLALPQIGYNLVELARTAEIDMVDIDASEINKLGTRIREGIVCDAAIFIDLLLELLDGVSIPTKGRWIERCDIYRNDYPWVDKEHSDVGGFINSYRFMERLNGFFKPNQIVVTDMGTALLSGHQVLRFKPGQRLMTSTGLGEMGYGLPAAIGASMAIDGGEVMCLNCDGGMMMNLQELQTVVHHNLPIKLFIFNNDGYLMIKHTQNTLFRNNRIGVDRSTGVSCPDFSKVATAFGIPSYQIRGWDNCDEVIRQVQDATGPVICEVFMHPNQLFSPKLGWSSLSDGTQISSPLEDLSPLISPDKLRLAMIIGVHEKSEARFNDFYRNLPPCGL